MVGAVRALAMLHLTRAETLAENPPTDGGPLQGTVEHERMGQDRETALIEDI